jgi:RNA polymerase sigma-70 factor, ECF subfamily
MKLTATDVRTDEQLARDSAAGCVASFDLLVRRYQVPLLRYLRTRFRNVRDSEDVLQDIVLAAWKHIGQFDPGRSFPAWIFTITFRTAVSHSRRRGLRLADEIESATTGSVLDAVARDESESSIWTLARSLLNEEAVAAMWMYHVEEMTAIEIGAAMSRTPESVRAMLVRARRRLEHDDRFRACCDRSAIPRQAGES